MHTISTRVALSSILAVSVAALPGCNDRAPRPPLIPSPQDVPPPSNPAIRARTITGLVHEAYGGRLAEVAIVTYPGPRSIVGLTRPDGSFRLERFAGDRVWFERVGYVTTSWSVPAGALPNESFEIEVPIQAALAVVDGRPFSDVITSEDVDYRRRLATRSRRERTRAVRAN